MSSVQSLRLISEEVRPDASSAVAPHRALLVDEDSGLRNKLQHDFEGRGFEVLASDDRGTAMALAASFAPEMVVLELRLRAGSGLELVPELRQRLPSAHLIVLTSYGSVASAVRAIRLGATNYLCKPAGVDELLRARWQETTERPIAPDAEAPAMLTLDEAIWEYIHRTVEASGSISEAARQLGLWRQSLKRMISKYRPGRSFAPPAQPRSRARS